MLIKKIKPLNFWEKIYLPAIIKGLGITIKHLIKTLFLRQGFTIQYPEQKKQIYPRFRGLHRLNKHEDGRVKCVACELCATACPSKAITIIAAESENPNIERYPLVYEIDLFRCIFCGFCEEACPKDAICLTNTYDKLHNEKRKDFIYGKERLMNT